MPYLLGKSMPQSAPLLHSPPGCDRRCQRRSGQRAGPARDARAGSIQQAATFGQGAAARVSALQVLPIPSASTWPAHAGRWREGLPAAFASNPSWTAIQLPAISTPAAAAAGVPCKGAPLDHPGLGTRDGDHSTVGHAAQLTAFCRLHRNMPAPPRGRNLTYCARPRTCRTSGRAVVDRWHGEARCGMCEAHTRAVLGLVLS